MKRVGKRQGILLILIAIAFLAYLGTHVAASPHPEQIVVVKVGAAGCPTMVSETLRKEPGIVGIASVAGTGEYHIGIDNQTSADAVRRKLAGAGIQATVVGTVSPVDYRERYGHYFQIGTFVSCNGGCGK